MRLLFDQNISYRILKQVVVDFPESNHITQLGLYNASDVEIWEFAKSNSYHIVTFDSDFSNLAVFRGCPPKIIWLRLKDMRSNIVASILKSKVHSIREFLEIESMKEVSVLELFD